MLIELIRVPVPLAERLAFHRAEAVWHTHTLPAALCARVGGWLIGGHQALIMLLWSETPDAFLVPTPSHHSRQHQLGSTEVVVHGHRGLVRAVQDSEHLILGPQPCAAPGLQLSASLPGGGFIGLWSSALHQAQAQPDAQQCFRVVPAWRLPYRFRTPKGPEALRSP